MGVPQDIPQRVATEWFSAYSCAMQAGDAKAVAATFLPDGWFRDALVYSWNNRALEGHEKIVDYLSSHMDTTKAYGFKMMDDQYFRPQFFPGHVQGISFGYRFETQIGWGQGYVQLYEVSNTSEWKAQVVSAMLVDLKGHEEPGRQNFEDFVEGRTWPEYRAEYEARVEADPYVIIIGAGQVGLQVAARFKQMNIPALVVERNASIGDSWRKRYDSLALHTLPEHHQMLYHPLPSNWPKWPPRDKVANLLETYAVMQELLIWMKSYPIGRPTYSKETKKWTITINHDGKEVEFHPSHLVLATGTLGAPYIPSMTDRDAFTGSVIHSSSYTNTAPFVGKEVIVVGSGQSAVDICDDLAHAGVPVTMVQRSATGVSGRDWTMAQVAASTFPVGVPAEVSDFKYASLPRGYLYKCVMDPEAIRAYNAGQADLHQKLKKGGLTLDMETPQVVLWWKRMGGYWLDKGAADQFESGNIRVRSGVEATAFTETGLRLSDGSEVKGNVIIFATGYVNIREVNKQLFGADVIDQTSQVWGMDEEGEICGSYRPSGYPRFWYASGDFWTARTFSKQLALHIKAIELGLNDA